MSMARRWSFQWRSCRSCQDSQHRRPTAPRAGWPRLPRLRPSEPSYHFLPAPLLLVQVDDLDYGRERHHYRYARIEDEPHRRAAVRVVRPCERGLTGEHGVELSLDEHEGRHHCGEYSEGDHYDHPRP